MSSPGRETAETSELGLGGGSGPLRLIVSSEAGVQVAPVPPQGRVVLGRSKQADVIVDDATVSRRHAVLALDADGMTLEDLGSRHGTRVFGEALAKGARRRVAAGASFEIGAVTVLIDRRAKDAPSCARHATDAVVEDPAMRRLWGLLEVIGPSSLHVLVLGETGVGKEVFTEALVAASPRAGASLLRINCAALSPQLLESELFGHEKGAFTGADRAKVGLIESASGGTVFLDEVGELPLDLQAKLLRVVEAGEVLPVGSVKPRKVDVRYVAATHVALEQAVVEKRFRADLLYRLNGFTVMLPPLRERRRDIAPLAERFIAQAAQRMGVPAPRLGAEALALFDAHRFPGNVRELKNIVERAVALARGAPVLAPEHIVLDGRIASAPEAAAPAAEPAVAPLGDAIAGFERERIEAALRATGGNQTAAAKLLGISRRGLINKIEQHDIARPRKR